MLRPNPSPLPVRVAWGIFSFCASLKLAVILIFSLAAVLAIATFVESAYGLRAVHFAIYGTWWFTLLGLLLAVNIFSAAAIRYPWKRHQTGFVITHIGLLTLLFGCLLSRVGGIDAQMPVFEDQMNHLAFEDSSHFYLAVHSNDLKQGQGTDDDESSQFLVVPEQTGPIKERRSRLGRLIMWFQLLTAKTEGFRGGPFNWDELETLRQFPTIQDWRDSTKKLGVIAGTSSCVGRALMAPIWRLAVRDDGIIYDADGIKLEVLDYYSNSTEVNAPLVDLKVSTPRMPSGVDADGREKLSPETWVPVRLEVGRSTGHLAASRPFGVGERQAMGGGSFVFWLAGSEAEQKAFQQSKPEGTVGPKGQVRLMAGGAMHTVDVAAHQPGERFPLGDTGLEGEVVGFFGSPMPKPDSRPDEFAFIDGAPGAPPEQPAVELKVYKGDDLAGRVVLFADFPELSLQGYEHEVFGTFWFDKGEKTSEQRIRGEGGSRIDIIQAPSGALDYRYWNGRELVALAELPADGTRVNAFKMPIAQLEMYVERHIPAPRPEKKVLPVPFDKEMIPTGAFRAHQLRLTVDDASEEFWLVGGPPSIFSGGPSPLEKHTVESAKRSVTIRAPLDEVDIGFNVRLQDFERKLDPGTSQASHFSSIVDFVALPDASDAVRRTTMPRDVLITMNAPVDFSDPESGKSYRLFQEAFRGPFLPGDRIFQTNVSDASDREHLYLSILTVNYDPGRGVKYLGCMLVVAGIVTMFYMRAYFFKPQARVA